MTTFESLEDDSPLLNSLADFPQLPPPGYVTIGELNGQFELRNYGNSGSFGYESVFKPYTEHHIPVSKKLINPTQAHKIPLMKTAGDNSFLLEMREGGLKSIWTAWLDDGLLGSVDALQNIGVPKILTLLLRRAIESAKMIRNSKRILKTLLFPHLALSNEAMIAAYSPIRAWETSWIRAMTWHPHFPRLAIALRDDSIVIFINEPTSMVFPSLKAPEQQLVSCISWHPYVNEFVVGVESGFIVWTLRESSKDGFSTSRFTSTVSIGHAPVTSVDYCRAGHKLLTSSTADTSILVWTLCQMQKTPLYRLAGGGVPRAAWAPNTSTQVFSTTPTPVFRLWGYEDSVMKPKRWTTVKSHVEAFAWHPSGTFVVFVSASLLFRLTIGLFGTYEILPVFDFGEIKVSQDQDATLPRIGGEILQIEWDPSGQRLAVLFAESPFVAVLGLYPGRDMSLHPCDFICGQEGEVPVGIAFQKDFKNGALLTIAWSTERVQYFPFLFAYINQRELTMAEECRLYSSPLSHSQRRDSRNGNFSNVNISSAAFTSLDKSQHFRLFSSDKILED